MSTAAPDHRPAESQSRPIDDQFTPTDWSLFVAVATIWGSSFLFIDIGLDALPPGVITLMRVGLGALALAAMPRHRIPVVTTDRPRVIALSIVWVAVPFTLFPIAEQHISSAVAGLLNGGTPIFAAVFAAVLYRQRTRGAQLLGIAVGFVGVVLVSLPSIGDGSSEALGVALMGNLVGRVGSTRASFITYLIPAVALVLGVVFRGDDVVALELVGIVFVIAGALLASRRISPRQTPTSAGRISPICPTSNQSA